MVDKQILHNRYKKKLDQKFKKTLKFVGNSLYSSPNGKIRLICTRCKTKQTNRATIILSRNKNEGCLFCKYEKELQNKKYILQFIKYCSESTSFTLDQIIDIANIDSNKWIEKLIKNNKKKNSKTSLVIIAFDPGTKNHAYSVIKLNGKKDLQSIEILDSGMMQNTIQKLDEFLPDNMILYEKELVQLYKKYKPDITVTERFQSRSYKGSGNINELVNIMIGKLVSVAIIHSKLTKLIMPAMWKNKINMLYNDKEYLEKMYLDYKDIGPHRLDATLMGVYMYPNTKKDVYSFLKKNRKNLKKHIKNRKGVIKI